MRIRSDWIIFRLEDFTAEVVTSFEAIEDDLRRSIEQRRVRDLFEERTDDFQRALDDFSTIEDMAAALNLEVQTSSPLPPAATYIPDFGIVERWGQDLQRLEVGQVLGEVITTPDTVGLIRLQEDRPRTVEPLDDDLRDRIRLTLTQIRAQEHAEESAYRVLDVVQGAAPVVSGEFFTRFMQGHADLADIVAEEILTEPFRPITDNIPQVGPVEDLAADLYYSPIETISGVQAIATPGGQRDAGYVIWVIQERIAPERADFYQALSTVRAGVLADNQDRLIHEWYVDAAGAPDNRIVRHDLSLP